MYRLGVHFAQKKLYTQLAGVDMLVNVSLHTNPPKIVSDHVDHSADALLSFGDVKFCNDNGC